MLLVSLKPIHVYFSSLVISLSLVLELSIALKHSRFTAEIFSFFFFIDINPTIQEKLHISWSFQGTVHSCCYYFYYKRNTSNQVILTRIDHGQKRKQEDRGA